MGRVLEEVVLQGLGLTGSGLILARFEGDHVVERSHFHSYRVTLTSTGGRYHGILNRGCKDEVAGVWFVSLYWFGLGLGTVWGSVWGKKSMVECILPTALVSRKCQKNCANLELRNTPMYETIPIA